MKQIEKPDNSSQSSNSTFIAIALCVAFYLGWTKYLSYKYPDYNNPQPVATDATAPAPTDANTPAGTTSPVGTAAQALQQPQASAAPRMSDADLVVENADARFRFDQDLGSPKSILLKNYKDSNTADSGPVELLARPFAVQSFVTSDHKSTMPLPFAGTRDGRTISFSREDGPWKIAQVWSIPETGYATKFSIVYTNTSAQPQPLAPSTLFAMGANALAAKSSFFSKKQPSEDPRFLTQNAGSDEFKKLQDFCKDQSLVVSSNNTKLDFFGFDTHYFLAAMVPGGNATYHTSFLGTDGANAALCEILTTTSTDLGMIAPGQAATQTWDAWFGPKEDELLTAFNPHLRTTLGLGWLDMIAHPLLLCIKGLYKFLGNYGLAVISLTLLLKILFYPLTKQAAASAAKMKKLNPEMQAIKEKFKNDPQRVQMETMKFMSAHKINPMKGCLPILPQIPVFFALFRVASSSIELRHAPFYGWILDLSAGDPYFVTPILLTACMFIQQRLTPMTGMDKNQEKIMMMMPVIFGVMMLSLPSGVVLYMLTNTIVSISQQQYLNRKLAAHA